MLVNIKLILEVFVEKFRVVKVLHFIDTYYMILTFPQIINIFEAFIKMRHICVGEISNASIIRSRLEGPLLLILKTLQDLCYPVEYMALKPLKV